MKQNELFLCYTPFHLAICLRYFQSYGPTATRRIVLYVGPKNHQSHFYLSAIGDYARLIQFKFSKSRIHMLIKIIYLSLIPEIRSSQTLYCANYKLIYTRLIILFIGFKNYKKFDDGIGDLLENSWFTKEENILSYYFFRAFSPKINYSNLRSIDRAFTIYPQLCDEGVKYVSLFDSNDENLQKGFIERESCTILLGQCYSSGAGPLNKQEELQLILKAIEEFSVDIFIPHPLCNIDFDEIRVEVMTPSVIAEEYVARLVESRPVRVLGFRTSAIFNLRESLPKLVRSGCLELINLTVYLDGSALGAEWSGDIWAKSFKHVPIHISSNR